MGRARLEREGGFRMWGGGTLLLSARESYDLLFLEMGLEVLEMNGHLVSFPPGVGSGVRGDTQQCVEGVGEKYLNFCPFARCGTDELEQLLSVRLCMQKGFGRITPLCRH